MLRGLNKVIKAKHLEQWLELNMWALVISTGNAKECSNYQTIALISHAQGNAQFPSGEVSGEVSAVHEPRTFR